MSSQNDNKSSNLASDLIIAEFNYISTTVFQADEDRATVSQFFFVSIGTFLAAILSTQFENTDISQLHRVFSIVFVLIYGFGLITIMQLVRLRQAWRESIFAMNQIKETAQKKHPELDDYFRWKTTNMPPAFKPKSIGFLQAIMVAVLGGLAIGSSLGFYQLVTSYAITWLWCILTGILGAVINLLFYWLPLRF